MKKRRWNVTWLVKTKGKDEDWWEKTVEVRDLMYDKDIVFKQLLKSFEIKELVRTEKV